jgi:hypothetical protein
MALYVRVVDGEVKDVWDTVPAEGVGNNGWMNAIEVRPNITPNRQGYTGHTFDLTKDPVQIVYGVYDISVEDRKAGMKAAAGFEFQQVVNEQTRRQLNPNPDEQYDSAAVEAARQTMVSKQTAIDSASSHDELDLLM